MNRQLVVAIVLGLGLSACGVGVDEDYASLGLGLQQGATATSQDPVPPPKNDPTTLSAIAEQAANITVISAGSTMSSAPGEENGSSQDPIPPKVLGPRQTHQFR